VCGRFTLTADPAELQSVLEGLELPANGLSPRYNIAPSQAVAVSANDNPRSLAFYKWGLIPSWAKDPAIGSNLINARAETLAEKPAFRSAFRRRRCLIWADGFYEWQAVPGQKSKIPTYIRLQSGRPFALAGLWESWREPAGDEIRTCTIITTQPNQLMQPIHNRMPVILPASTWSQWLDPQENDPTRLSPLLTPYPAAEMQAYPVSSLVNNPINDLPACIQPRP
jgi:putative SOS response-associated peptidase YedK